MAKSRCKMAFFYIMFLFLTFFLFLFAFFLKDTSCQYLNQKCKNILIVIVFSVLCITSFVCFTVIILKDGEKTSLAKLKALVKAKEDFSSGDNSKLVTEERTEKTDGEIIIVERKVYCELMKTYMQSITEI